MSIKIPVNSCDIIYNKNIEYLGQQITATKESEQNFPCSPKFCQGQIKLRIPLAHKNIYVTVPISLN